MTYKMEWRADVDALSNEAFNAQLAEKDLYGLGYPEEFGVSGAMYFRESAALIYIKRAVQKMQSSGKEVDKTSPYLTKLYSWMQQIVKDENKHMLPVIPEFSGSLKPEEGEESEDFILRQSCKTGAQGAMLESRT
jgi:hypothetical protein